jgi:hypothetical protein
MKKILYVASVLLIVAVLPVSFSPMAQGTNRYVQRVSLQIVDYGILHRGVLAQFEGVLAASANDAISLNGYWLVNAATPGAYIDVEIRNAGSVWWSNDWSPNRLTDSVKFSGSFIHSINFYFKDKNSAIRTYEIRITLQWIEYATAPFGQIPERTATQNYYFDL